MSPVALSIAVACGLLGLAAGSFLNAYIYRLRNGIEEGMLDGRSFCPQCHATLSAIDLIPVASFLALGGRCRTCRSPIGWHYPLVEAGAASLFFLFGLTQAGTDPLQFGVGLGALFTLYALAAYDAHTMEVPLVPVAVGTVLGLFSVVTLAVRSGTADPLLSTALSAGIAVAFFGFQIIAGRGRWLGTGDLYVGLFLATLLPYPLYLLMLMAAYVSGAAFALPMLLRRERQKRLPLVPFLAFGAVFALLFGQAFLSWYAGLLGLA